MNMFDDVEKDDPTMSNVTSCGCVVRAFPSNQNHTKTTQKYKSRS